MNELNHIPLEEMLMMSFKAFDEGDSILGEKYYKTFEQTKDKALKLAEKAVQAGDTNTVDIIIQSFEKAKALSQERMKENKIKIESQSNIQKNIQEQNIFINSNDTIHTVSENEETNKKEKIDNLAKDILLQFQKSKSDAINDDISQKKQEKVITKKAKSKKNKSNTDTLLKKYLQNEEFDIGEKRAKKLLDKNKHSEFLYNYLGVCQAQQKKFSNALESFDKTLSINPNADDAMFNKSLIKLRLGELSEGWDLYSYGLTKNNNIREINESFFSEETPLWDGQPFDGTLLVYAEQGIGDQLMFGTIIEDLLKVQNNVAIIVDDRLKKLFERTYPNVIVFGLSEDRLLLNHDKHIAVGDLCKYFRNDIKHFKDGNFKKFVTSQEKDDQIRTLMPKNNGLKIGISWLTFAKKNVNKRNLSTKEISSIINSNDHTFINLQYGNINDQLSELNEISKKPLYQVPGIDLTYNIDSLASIIKNCDLIITIDNSTAHLAAVLGKPVWILIPFNNDFRWMENSEETIWYKNALLLRQNQKNDWSQAIYNINSALDQ